MALFKAPVRNTGKAQDNKIAKKANATTRVATATVKGSGGIIGRISSITAMVDKYLSKYKEESIVIDTEEVLHEYISVCIENNVISIDTETTGLDPMLDEIAGICIYTPGQKTAYIPINHISYITFLKVPEQLPLDIIRQEFQRIADNKTQIIMFNGPFDVRFMEHQVGVRLHCYWDCMPASKLLNENELAGEGGLKALHKKYCLNGKGDAFKFDDLFKGIPFTQIPIRVGYLYAAHDAKITYELYQFQKPYLIADDPVCIEKGLQDVAWVFHNIEMPMVDVVIDMEDRGITFDLDYNTSLSKKYNILMDERKQHFYELCDMYRDKIEAYENTVVESKLDNPINIASPTQIAILLYDILKIEPPDKRNPRATGVEALSKMDNPIAKAVLAYREMAKLITTYIDKMPDCVNPNDGRVHCKFHQYGAATGRMSSSDPNLQNIPSHNKDIRQSFVAQKGYVLLSSDFSQQEPKCLAALCRKSGDDQMYNTFMQGKDLYSEIASKAFNVPYEECREFRPDGTTNKAGKERRTQAKSVLLGVLYGRGEASIGEQLHVSTQKAKDIKESVFKGFPAIKKFEQDSLKMAHDIGFVTTVCGRKRRLPDLQLDEFEFTWKAGCAPQDDLLDFDDTEDVDVEVPYDRQRYYRQKLRSCRFWEKHKWIEQASEEGIHIVDNGGKIADATRQCVNSRIQGSAADLTKIAMVALNNDERLKELGFRLLVPVHDEVIAECPEENVKECSERLADIMCSAAEKVLDMPISCDVEISRAWYGPSLFINEEGKLVERS
jgi:DNA polymerase I-like protein with 3'-5' exonuclease and polymerase domains